MKKMALESIEGKEQFFELPRIMKALNRKKMLIKNQTCFSKLEDHEAEVLATLLIEKKIKKGETIVTEGDSVDSFYLITSGTADVRVRQPNNVVISVAELCAANFDAIGLNETGFYSLSGLRTATVVALTDMTLFYLALPIFHGFALFYPHVCEVMREQAEKFLKVNTFHSK